MFIARQTVRINGWELYTESTGTRPDSACLLISGAMSSAHFWTDRFCACLVEKGFFVIRYDHRDSGDSLYRDGDTPLYDLADLAVDAVAILDAYGIQQAHIIGHSMGGYIAQQLALTYPKRLLSISILSAGPIAATADTDRPLSPSEQAIQEETWRCFLARQDGSSEASMVHSFMPVWAYLHGTFPVEQMVAERYTRDLVQRSRRTLRAGNAHERVMHALDREANRGALERIDVPTLILHGAADPHALPREGYALARAIFRADFVLIPGMGHLFFHHDLETKIAGLLIEHMQHAACKMLEHNICRQMTYFAGKVYSNNLKHWLLTRRLPEFEPNEVGAEAAKLEKFSDAGGLKVSGCPTPSKTNASGCLSVSPMELQRETDVTVVTADIPDDMFNSVLFAHFTEENAAQRTKEVLSYFRGCPFSWRVSGLDTPPSLVRILTEHGLVYHDQEKGMMVDVASLPTRRPSPLNFQLVHNEKRLASFAQIVREVGRDLDYYERFYKKIPLSYLTHIPQPLGRRIDFFKLTPKHFKYLISHLIHI